MNIVITGSNGMLGYHLLDYFIKNNDYNLFCIDRDFKKAKYVFERVKIIKGKGRGVDYQKYNLCSTNFYKYLDKIKPDYIIHLAADANVSSSFKNPQEMLLNNNNSFLNVLEYIRKYSSNTKLIYASSSAVYGESKDKQNEENKTLSPVSSYGLSKLMNEQMADLYYKNYGIQSVGLRFFTLYGEYNRSDMLFHYLLESFVFNREVSLFNNGLMKRDFTYVGDVAKIIGNIIESHFPEKNEVFNIGTSENHTLIEIVNLMKKHFKNEPNIVLKEIIPISDPIETCCLNDKILKKYPNIQFTNILLFFCLC